MASLWKEYSQADSRYAWREAFIVSMEAFTAFVEGPASFVIAWAMAAGKPWRLPLMMLTAFGQLYGCVLYFATSWHGGFADVRPEPIFYWFYFWIINSVWIVVPTYVCFYAWGKMTEGVRVMEAPAVKAAGLARNGKGK